MKLFAVYIGGEMPSSHIELHDMRFVPAERIEDTYDTLREQWWGTPDSLHIDGWAEITRTDGYTVSLRPERCAGEEKLYFVNLGGYDPAQFTELHENVFVVGATESKAKVKALKKVRHWQSFHRDFMYEAEKIFDLQSAINGTGLYIHLEKTDDESPPPFTCYYQPVGIKKP